MNFLQRIKRSIEDIKYGLGMGLIHLDSLLVARQGIPLISPAGFDSEEEWRDFLKAHPLNINPEIWKIGKTRRVKHRVVTTAFVNFVVDQLQTETSVFGDFKYHESGQGGTAENASDTDIETIDMGTRDTGSQTEGASANIYKSVATRTYDGSYTVVEHGLFNDASAGTLMDRTVFASIGVANGNQIEFTYELTLTAGS